MRSLSNLVGKRAIRKALFTNFPFLSGFLEVFIRNDSYLHPAVFLSPGSSFVGGHRLFLSIPSHGKPAGAHILLGEVSGNGTGAALG
jgi:hypothetical protein